jgi:integrating conjugative element protein (TIGR03749 family)
MNLFCRLLLASLGVATWLSCATVLTAAPQNTETKYPALPLSPVEINKLQKLLSESKSNSAVPIFSNQEPHEHVIWNQTPIDVVLPVGIERLVSFSSQVQFGYDKKLLPDDTLQVQNNNGVLYLQAKKEFSKQRVEVKINDSGKIILLNLSAKIGADKTPLEVVLAVAPVTVADITNHDHTDKAVSAVTLTRFAVQQLYAPKRLLTQPPNIFRTPMHTQKTVPLMSDGSVLAMPLASWRSGDLYVTAVLLRNQLKQILDLDPRKLNGHWQAATFYPNTVIEKAGTSFDSTTVFLVSKRPFAESLTALQ